MPIQYQLDKERDLLVLRASGVVTSDDAMGIIDKALTETRGAAMRKDMLFLLGERASLSDIDLDAIQRIKSHLEGWLKIYPRKPVRYALVSSGPGQKAVGELWRVMTDADPLLAAETRTFSSEAAALAWLRPKSSAH